MTFYTIKQKVLITSFVNVYWLRRSVNIEDSIANYMGHNKKDKGISNARMYTFVYIYNSGLSPSGLLLMHLGHFIVWCIRLCFSLSWGFSNVLNYRSSRSYVILFHKSHNPFNEPIVKLCSSEDQRIISLNTQKVVTYQSIKLKVSDWLEGYNKWQVALQILLCNWFVLYHLE